VAYLVNRATDTIGLDMNKCTAVVQGYGNVGSIAALSMARYGAKVIAVSDAFGGIHNAKGLDLFALEKFVAEKKTVVGFPRGRANHQRTTSVIAVRYPRARGAGAGHHRSQRGQDQMPHPRGSGQRSGHAEADVILNQRPEIFVIPDILCNAGGVIVSYFEWVQDLQSFFWGETEITDKLFRILETSFTQIVGISRKQKIPMRLAALSVGVKRVQEAKKIRGLFPYKLCYEAGTR
jgi:glutamate dehydrogenase (NAD(P)+)